MKIIVVGGGKVGYYLTKTLLEHGHSPRLIERDRTLCTRLANDLDVPVVCGDGTIIDILEASEADGADALIAVTGRDQDNLVACQLAKEIFHVGRTVARINNPKNAAAMKQLGVDIPISSTDNIARLLEREVDTAAIKQLMPLNRGEASLSELQIPEKYDLDGIRLVDLHLPEESVIVSISRGGRLIIPRGNSQILSGDKLLVVCANTALRELSERLSLKKET
ncbi:MULTISPECIES: potassium channel family protein [Anaerotruncus]|jgi:trk system potassium uptake protein TrkA|uniref:potassium channel family protein n=1 Tax=Anaerotruncus TaxID=244127 RepID=UPI00082F3318|nr:MULTISPECIES: TrkA family potassium uptake protein [Anaerotruncus]RGX53311.1 TrkA family potassium uptake protein [Anaerotruncus sp. AF02-27]